MGRDASTKPWPSSKSENRVPPWLYVRVNSSRYPRFFRKRKCPMLVVCRKLPMPGTGPRQSAFSTIRRSLSFTRSKPEYPFMPRASHSALSAWTEAFSSSPCFQNAAAPMGSPSIITEAMDHTSLLPSTCLQHKHAHAKNSKGRRRTARSAAVIFRTNREKKKAAMGSPRLHPHPHGRPAGPGSLPSDKIQAQNDITARLGIKPNRTGKST